MHAAVFALSSVQTSKEWTLVPTSAAAAARDGLGALARQDKDGFQRRGEEYGEAGEQTGEKIYIYI